MARKATETVLVGYRPGFGILAQTVRDFDHAVELWRSLSTLFAPGLLADIIWWVEPNSSPRDAGTAALDGEYGPWLRAR